MRPQVGWKLGPQPDSVREVDDPVGLKGRGEETVVLNDHSLHRVLGGHEQGAGAGDIHRGDVVEPALGSTESCPGSRSTTSPFRLALPPYVSSRSLGGGRRVVNGSYSRG